MSVRRQTLAAALGASISAGWAEPTYREAARRLVRDHGTKPDYRALGFVIRRRICGQLIQVNHRR